MSAELVARGGEEKIDEKWEKKKLQGTRQNEQAARATTDEELIWA